MHRLVNDKIKKHAIENNLDNLYAIADRHIPFNKNINQLEELYYTVLVWYEQSKYIFGKHAEISCKYSVLKDKIHEHIIRVENKGDQLWK